eukprot:RCo004804
MASPNIVLCSVARRTVILVQHAEARTESFITVVRDILNGLPEADSRMSFLFEQHMIHYVVLGQLCALCIAQEAYTRSRAYAFLNEVIDVFKRTYTEEEIMKAGFLQFNTDFSRTLRRIVDRYNALPNMMAVLRRELNETAQTVNDDVDRLLERGERVERLVTRSELLGSEAVLFRRQAVRVKRSFWWKLLKMKIILALVVLVIGGLVFLVACSGLQCVSKNKS